MNLSVRVPHSGLAVAFALSIFFGDRIWHIVASPVMDARRCLGYTPRVIFTTPTEAFLTVWMKMPLLASVFLASPWILYQLWAFVAPGLSRSNAAGPRHSSSYRPDCLSSAACSVTSWPFATGWNSC